MKELSIEEKAKRYDEAVNEIKNLRDMLLKEGVINKNGVIWDNFNRIFPELKESEDERIIERIKKAVESYWSDEPLDEILSWLEKQGERKSLDDIAKEVTKDKDAAISFLKSTGIINENGELADEYKIEQGEQNHAWSEEDEKITNDIKESLLAYKIIVMDNDMELANYIEKEINWFKSIKERYTWKPSDEQMKALGFYIKTYVDTEGCYGSEVLELYEQLKKLREE